MKASPKSNGGGAASIKNPKQTDPSNQSYVADEVVVRFREERVDISTAAGGRAVAELARNKNLKKMKEVKGQNSALFQAESKKTVEELVEELRADPNVLYAEPNYVRRPFAIMSNDTLKDSLWALHNTGQFIEGSYAVNNPGTSDSDMDVPEAWLLSEGTTSPVIVAVIDSGVAYTHSDLVANMWDGQECLDGEGAYLGWCMHGYDFEDQDTNPFPSDSAHGTMVAGVISAEKNNGQGITGIAPHAKIMALKFGLDVFSEVQAIDFAIQNGARIINASYGDYSFSQMEYDAIERFRDAGGLFVAASGNWGEDNDDSWPMYPASYDLDNIIAVSATDQADVLANFSNYGAFGVDVGAPGTNILTTTAEELVYEESFEDLSTPDLPTGWTRDGVQNNWGTVTHAPGDVWGRVGNSLYGDLNRPYASGTDSVVTSPVIDLSSVSSPSMTFTTVCDTEYSPSDWTDYMELYFGSQNQDFTAMGVWDEIALDWYADEDPVSDSGSARWAFTIPISESFQNHLFQYRFRWVTNDVDNDFEGCSVKDVRIAGIGDGGYETVDGTSFSAPYVAGLAALMLGYNGSLTYAQLKQTIMDTGDPSPSLSGVTVSGKRVNARTALEAVTPYFISTSSDPVDAGTVVDMTPISGTWS